MPEPTEITADMLGTFTGADAPIPESPAAASGDVGEPAEETITPTTAPAPAESEAETDADEYEDLTLDDLGELISGSVSGAIDKMRAAEESAEATEGLSPDVKKLTAENKALTERLAAVEKESKERILHDTTAALEHTIASTAGKFKMTDSEIAATTDYILDDPGILKARGFEWCALHVHPELRGRLKAAPNPAPPASAGADGMVVAPAANGAGAPEAFKHTPSRGDYSDVTRHIIKSGEAAKLGKYT